MLGGAASQDATITGPFVVWADPVAGFSASSQSTTEAGGPAFPFSLVLWMPLSDNAQLADSAACFRYSFYLVFLGNLILCCLIFADTINQQKSDPKGQVNYSMPPMELTAAFFTISILFKLIGAWGVYTQRIRHISAFIAVGLLLTICKSKRARIVRCLDVGVMSNDD